MRDLLPVSLSRTDDSWVLYLGPRVRAALRDDGTVSVDITPEPEEVESRD
jgi:hypothetical protein